MHPAMCCKTAIPLPSSIKMGTKVKNIRLVNADHDIDCKIDGFGAMSLKSEFVKKV
jgi:protein PhnA